MVTFARKKANDLDWPIKLAEVENLGKKEKKKLAISRTAVRTFDNEARSFK